MRYTGAVLWLFAGAAILLSGAARSSEGGVAALVDGVSITRAAVDRLAAQTDPAQPDGQARAAALERLIDHQLLVQAARRAGLDRDPAVRIDRERARRRVLVEAYLERVLTAVPAPTAADVDRFIADHPAQFGERRTYHFLRIVVPALPQWPAARLRSLLTLYPDLRSIAARLNGQGLPVEVESLWQGTERIEPAQLSALDRLADGGQQLLPGAGGHGSVLLQRLQVFPDQLEAARVRGAVARGLLADARDRSIKAHLAVLRQAARIVVPAAPEAGTDAAATVDGAPIARAEVDRAVTLKPEMTRQEALDSLIDERLFAHAAARVLAAAPGLAAAQQTAAEQVLVERYLDDRLAGAAVPGVAAVETLVAQRREFFADRHVFHFEETILDGEGVTPDTVRARLAGRPPGAWPGGWVVARNGLWRGPEQLDTVVRKTLQDLHDGGVAVLALPGGHGVVVLRRLASYPDPVDAAEAGRKVAALLRERARQQARRELMVQLRERAAIRRASAAAALPLQPPDRGGAVLRHSLSVIALAYVAALPLLWGGAIAWLLAQSWRRLEFTPPTAPRPVLRQRLQGWTYSMPFLAGVVGSTGCGAALVAVQQWFDAGAGLPPLRCAIAAAVGVAAGAAWLAVLWRFWRRAASPAWLGRWWPLALVLALHGVLRLAVWWH